MGCSAACVVGTPTDSALASDSSLDESTKRKLSGFSPRRAKAVACSAPPGDVVAVCVLPPKVDGDISSENLDRNESLSNLPIAHIDSGCNVGASAEDRANTSDSTLISSPVLLFPAAAWSAHASLFHVEEVADWSRPDQFEVDSERGMWSHIASLQSSAHATRRRLWLDEVCPLAWRPAAHATGTRAGSDTLSTSSVCDSSSETSTDVGSSLSTPSSDYSLL